METIKEIILKSELQREIEAAKRLEVEGKLEKAGQHYLKASLLYRKIASFSPISESQEMFNVASQYETLAGTVKSTAKDGIDKIADSFIVTQKPAETWNDVGNLDEAKRIIKESIILPFIRSKPDFVASPRTILLYGPPGTGKTLLAKASSNNIGAAFLEARLPSLLSKYFGESTKLVNSLFAKAASVQPSLIFIDELDALAIGRTGEMDYSTRRVLSQLLTELDGFNTRKEDRVLIMAATNKPWDLDDAIVSRFQRRIYIPLPDANARKRILRIHLKGAELSGTAPEDIAARTEGFSGRDLHAACQQAIMNMVREMNPEIQDLKAGDIGSYRLKLRPLNSADFESALEKIKPAKPDIRKYEEWKKDFGG